MIEKRAKFTIPADCLDLEDDIELTYADDLTEAEVEARIREEFQDWLDVKLELIRASAECIEEGGATWQDMD